MLWLVLIVFCYSTKVVELRRHIEVKNLNNFPIWIETLTNNNGAPLSNEIKRINAGGGIKYEISDQGWAGRLWPKIGCDQHGANCEFGQSIAPCPNGGCHPPADTKVEFFFAPKDSSQKSFYDISLVSGKFFFYSKRDLTFLFLYICLMFWYFSVARYKTSNPINLDFILFFSR